MITAGILEILVGGVWLLLGPSSARTVIGRTVRKLVSHPRQGQCGAWWCSRRGGCFWGKLFTVKGLIVMLGQHLRSSCPLRGSLLTLVWEEMLLRENLPALNVETCPSYLQLETPTSLVGRTPQSRRRTESIAHASDCRASAWDPALT